jgi:hypothetical protein
MLKTPQKPRAHGWLWAAAAVSMGYLALARPAYAQNDTRVADAKIACGSGDTQKGVRILAELFTETNDAIWIFNQGRCFQPALFTQRTRSTSVKKADVPRKSA